MTNREKNTFSYTFTSFHPHNYQCKYGNSYLKSWEASILLTRQQWEAIKGSLTEIPYYRTTQKLKLKFKNEIKLKTTRRNMKRMFPGWHGKASLGSPSANNLSPYCFNINLIFNFKIVSSHTGTVSPLYRYILGSTGLGA